MNLVFFYLNQFVFPENCFEFHTKISANGHNLADEKTGSRVTGFSGTDEKKLTMPYFVECKRSPSQETTNAKMLQLMLKENTEMHFLDFNNTSQFLKEVISFLFERENCNALIDAGALIIGLRNREVAEFILREGPQRVECVVYFEEDGNVCVLDRQKKVHFDRELQRSSREDSPILTNNTQEEQISNFRCKLTEFSPVPLILKGINTSRRP